MGRNNICDKHIRERLGETNKNNKGLIMSIIKYENSQNVTVQFEDSKYICSVLYDDFKEGKIKDLLSPSVYGIGYFGVGSYVDRTDGKITKRYETWRSMLRRCYSKNAQTKNNTYIGCSVCNEWHNFQVFAKWFDENYYEIDRETMCLDKDILVKGNKIYSPETCAFVPQNINCLFTKSNAVRGDLPIGVSFYKTGGRYVAYCNDGEKHRKHLGYFDTPEQAFKSYKTYKENLIKQIANEYKDKIPNNLYKSMITYIVEMED